MEGLGARERIFAPYKNRIRVETPRVEDCRELSAKNGVIRPEERRSTAICSTRFHVATTTGGNYLHELMIGSRDLKSPPFPAATGIPRLRRANRQAAGSLHDSHPGEFGHGHMVGDSWTTAARREECWGGFGSTNRAARFRFHTVPEPLIFNGGDASLGDLFANSVIALKSGHRRTGVASVRTVPSDLLGYDIPCQAGTSHHSRTEGNKGGRGWSMFRRPDGVGCIYSRAHRRALYPSRRGAASPPWKLPARREAVPDSALSHQTLSPFAPSGHLSGRLEVYIPKSRSG